VQAIGEFRGCKWDRKEMACTGSEEFDSDPLRVGADGNHGEK